MTASPTTHYIMMRHSRSSSTTVAIAHEQKKKKKKKKKKKSFSAESTGDWCPSIASSGVYINYCPDKSGRLIVCLWFACGLLVLGLISDLEFSLIYWSPKIMMHLAMCWDLLLLWPHSLVVSLCLSIGLCAFGKIANEISLRRWNIKMRTRMIWQIERWMRERIC